MIEIFVASVIYVLDIGYYNASKTVLWAFWFYGLDFCGQIFVPGLFFQNIKNSASGISREDLNSVGVICASHFHCLVIFILAGYSIYSPDNNYLRENLKDRSTNATQALISFSAGYFLYDIYAVMRRDPYDIAFMMHGLICAFAFWSGQKPYWHYFGVRLLIFELSTPLLNQRRLLYIVYKKRTTWTSRLEILFALVFFYVRLVWGTQFLFSVARTFISLLPEAWRNFHDSCAVGIKERAIINSEFFLPLFYIALVSMFQILNMFWMIEIVQKGLGFKGNRHHDQNVIIPEDINGVQTNGNISFLSETAR